MASNNKKTGAGAKKTPKEMVRCSYCGVEISRRSERSHYANFHNPNSTYQQKQAVGPEVPCPVAGCGYRFDRYHTCEAHCRKAHNLEGPGSTTALWERYQADRAAIEAAIEAAAGSH